MGGTGAFLALQKNSQAQTQSLPPGAPSAPPKPPPLDKELVKDFVIKGHFDLPATKALLEKEPGLLNSCWDWGGGDFETALEGAGHMGNKDIANFLLSKGARMNIFCAAAWTVGCGQSNPLRLSRAEDLERSARLAIAASRHQGRRRSRAGARVSQINRCPIIARPGKIDIDDFLTDRGRSLAGNQRVSPGTFSRNGVTSGASAGFSSAAR